jgi:hypothetical protein
MLISSFGLGTSVPAFDQNVCRGNTFLGMAIFLLRIDIKVL